MSSDTEVVTYDFRRPRRLADDIEQALAGWADTSLGLLQERWQQTLNVSIALSRLDVRTARRVELSQLIGTNDVCNSFGLGDDRHCMWFVLPRPFFLGTLAVMLGEEITELPEDRLPTDLERTLVEVTMQCVATAQTEGQPTVTPLSALLIGERRLQDVPKDFSEDESAVAMEVQMDATFGSAKAWWCLSQGAVAAYMNSVTESRQARSGNSDQLLETLRQIPMELIVQLGAANVHVAELMSLQPGDILVLDQRVNEPLVASVKGLTKFHAWPGRVGTRQAMRIASLAEEES